MDENFKKHKKRAQIFWIVKSLIIGVSAAMFAVGVVLLATCFAKVNLFWAWYVLIGICALAIGGGIPALCLRVTDQALARELDKKVDRERVQTALAYSESEEGIYELQRSDAAERIASVQIDFKPLWVYILVPVLSVVMFLSGLVCTLLLNKPAPPTEDNPYIVSDWQKDRLAYLIEYVQESDADDYTKTGIVSEIEKLIQLEKLGITDSGIQPMVKAAIEKIRSAYSEANDTYPADDIATDAQKQQKRTNRDVGEYVVKELYKIFEVKADTVDGDDVPPPDIENPGDNRDPNQGSDVTGSQQLCFDPELGYVYYQEIAQQYQNEINNALDSGLVSSDDWFDIVLLYFQFLNGAN